MHYSAYLRRKRIQELKACEKCLRKHTGRCDAPSCAKCGQDHHTLLCVVPRKAEQDSKRNVNGMLAIEGMKTQPEERNIPIMATVDVNASSEETAEKFEKLTVAMDTHATLNFITREAAERMQLKTEEAKLSEMSGFRAKSTMVETKKAQIFLQLTDGSKIKVDVLVVDQFVKPYQMITGIPQTMEEIKKYKIQLPLPKREPDVLLGVGEVAKLEMAYTDEKHPTNLSVVKTKLGYALSGIIVVEKSKKIEEGIVMVTKDENFDFKKTDDWDIKDLCDRVRELKHLGISEEDFEKTEEDEVVETYRKSMYRDEEGRYQVEYPIKEDIWKLDSQLMLAISRLKPTIEKLKRSPELLRTVNETIENQLKAGIIQEVRLNDELPEGSLPPHYLPHHIVTKDSETTKHRMVLDPTAKSKKNTLNKSLNECLHKGKPDLPTIFGILLRCRTFKTLVLSDVEKAFHQIGIAPTHRAICRWLMPKNVNRPLTFENLRVFEFKRLPFGLRPAPFMLQEAIKDLFEKAEGTLGKEILSNLYVDNVNIGADNDVEAQRKSEEARRILEGAQMNLREFISNGKIQMPEKLMGNQEKAKVLGVPWNVKKDTLRIKLPKVNKNPEQTRADFVSLAHSGYDPLQLLSPLFVEVKRYIQKMWKYPEYGWTKKFPAEFVEDWLEIVSTWNEQEFEFQRYTQIEDGDELHVFADASEYAFGAAIYAVNVKNRVSGGTLLASKSLITPRKAATEKGDDGKLKKIRLDEPQFTIPQGETAGAVTACRLAENVKRELQKNVKIYLWGDSTICLNWIRNGASDQPLAVRNMLRKIWKSEVANFGHVPTDQNPADIASRGTTPEELRTLTLWFKGPDFLRKEPEEWPSKLTFIQEGEPENKEDDEKQEIILPVQNVKPDGNENVLRRLFNQNSFRFAVRVTMKILKFIDKMKKKKNPEYLERGEGELLSEAQHTIYRIAQEEYPPTKDQIENLMLRKDPRGIWRSVGRIGSANVSKNRKFPVFVHQKSDLARLVIQHAHERVCHQGPRATLCWLRNNFWIPKGMRSTMSQIRRCPECLGKYRKPFEKPNPDALPQERITQAVPFENVGIDAFGPYRIQTEAGLRKRWGCIFACMVTRAVHLEVLEDMTSEAFMRAFKRFVATRGVPLRIITDNGTNFVGAEDQIRAYYAPERTIYWKFNDPRCPWKGGFYERLIGIVKSAFTRCAKKLRRIDDVELATLFKMLEDAVNNRPLLRSSDVRDQYTCLRPVDFLRPAGTYYYCPFLGENHMDDPDFVPEEARRKQKSHRDPAETRLHQMHLRMISILDELWTGWTSEYLLALRQFEKGRRNKKSGRKTPEVGEAVIVEDSILARDQWQTGIVKEILQPRGHGPPITAIVRFRKPAKDGNTKRKSNWKYENFVDKRIPIQSLYPLEIEKQDVILKNFDVEEDANQNFDEDVQDVVLPVQLIDNFEEKIEFGENSNNCLSFGTKPRTGYGMGANRRRRISATFQKFPQLESDLERPTELNEIVGDISCFLRDNIIDGNNFNSFLFLDINTSQKRSSRGNLAGRMSTEERRIEGTSAERRSQRKQKGEHIADSVERRKDAEEDFDVQEQDLLDLAGTMTEEEAQQLLEAPDHDSLEEKLKQQCGLDPQDTEMIG
ncbi:unnamed protein product [Bursaphelenchus xylophilus]|uniref:(pine wood nematode) hypothetical protein n=1 Tax=Bursaphelenchus xylophilus TaxID=6326 RepID=A0A1I7S6E1_BURXY|nr:unnamed protein product [Bursaphelenchus xylophilus]CAG9128090.1 unnamed protein product [Bursaphelenchus xylophilus]